MSTFEVLLVECGWVKGEHDQYGVVWRVPIPDLALEDCPWFAESFVKVLNVRNKGHRAKIRQGMADLLSIEPNAEPLVAPLLERMGLAVPTKQGESGTNSHPKKT